MNFFTRRNIIVIVSVLAFIGLFALILSLQNRKTTLTASQPFATNFKYAHQFDKNNIFYFTGSGFASYDTDTYKSRPLGPVYALPTATVEVKWSPKGALIHATGYSETDQLYPELFKQSLSPNRYYWWLVNFETGAITLVGNPASKADVSNAVWQDEDHFLYTEIPSSNSKTVNVISGSLKGKPSTVTTLPVGATLVDATTSGALYTQPDGDIDNLMSLNLSTKKTRTAVKNTSAVLAAHNGSALIVTDADKNDKKEYEFKQQIVRGTLKLYQDGNTTTIGSDFSGSAAWYNKDNRWLAVSRDTKANNLAYANNGKKTTQYSIKPLPNSDIQYQALGQIGENYLLSNGSNELLVAARNTATNLPSIKSIESLKGIIESNYYFTYNDDRGELTAYILQNPYQTNVGAVQERIKSLGHDPYQLNIVWRADASVDRGFVAPVIADVENPDPNAELPEIPIPVDPVNEGD